MNPKLQKLGTVAALLVMTATGQAGAADPHHDDTKPLLVASLSGDAASFSSQPSPAGSARGGKGPAAHEEIAAAGQTLLPEPGNWSMVLVGLLGVVAIARRRMSA